MTQITPDQLKVASAAAAPGSAASFWTPKNISDIVSGIKELLIEYNKLRGVSQQQPMAAAPVDMDMAAVRNSRGNGSPGQYVTMPQLKDFGRRLCDQLSQQGYGDSTILEVLTKFDLTIKQIRGLIQ